MIKEEWKDDLSKLYYKNQNSGRNKDFKAHAMAQKVEIENNMSKIPYITNIYFNRALDVNEVKEVVLKPKNGKSSGVHELPYEVLKNDAVINVLHKLFSLCFDNINIHVPSVWRKAIIFPISKDQNSDSRISMNYRGISILSVVSKVFSSILNNRLTDYLEDNNILVYEQNGFRSCEDHVLTINNVIQNRDSTFVTFIDLH